MDKNNFDVVITDSSVSGGFESADGKKKGLFGGKGFLGIGRSDEKKQEKKEKKEERKEKKEEKKAARKSKREERKEKRKEGGGVLGGAKKIALAPMRNAYLAVLKVNLFNLAGKSGDAIAKNPTAWANIKKRWAKFGGNPAALEKEINRGKGKKPLFAKPSKKKGADGYSDIEWTMVDADGIGYNYPTGVEEGGLAATIAAATPLIIAMKQILESAFGGKMTDADTENALNEINAEDGVTEDELLSDAEIAEEEKRANLIKWSLIGVGALVVVVGGILIFRKFAKK